MSFPPEMDLRINRATNRQLAKSRPRSRNVGNLHIINTKGLLPAVTNPSDYIRTVTMSPDKTVQNPKPEEVKNIFQKKPGGVRGFATKKGKKGAAMSFRNKKINAAKNFLKQHNKESPIKKSINSKVNFTDNSSKSNLSCNNLSSGLVSNVSIPNPSDSSNKTSNNSKVNLTDRFSKPNMSSDNPSPSLLNITMPNTSNNSDKPSINSKVNLTDNSSKPNLSSNSTSPSSKNISMPSTSNNKTSNSSNGSLTSDSSNNSKSSKYKPITISHQAHSCLALYEVDMTLKTRNINKTSTVSNKGKKDIGAPTKEKDIVSPNKEMKDLNVLNKEKKDINVLNKEKKDVVALNKEKKDIAASNKEKVDVVPNKEKKDLVAPSKEKDPVASNKEKKDIVTSNKEKEIVASKKDIVASIKEKKDIVASHKEKKDIVASNKEKKDMIAPKNEKKDLVAQNKERKKMFTQKDDPDSVWVPIDMKISNTPKDKSMYGKNKISIKNKYFSFSSNFEDNSHKHVSGRNLPKGKKKPMKEMSSKLSVDSKHDRIVYSGSSKHYSVMQEEERYSKRRYSHSRHSKVRNKYEEENKKHYRENDRYHFYRKSPEIRKPLHEDLDALEDVSDVPLDEDFEEVEAASWEDQSKSPEVPVGFRKYKIEYLSSKRLGFFRPKLYHVSQMRTVVSCLNIDEGEREKSLDVISDVEYETDHIVVGKVAKSEKNKKNETIENKLETISKSLQNKVLETAEDPADKENLVPMTEFSDDKLEEKPEPNKPLTKSGEDKLDLTDSSNSVAVDNNLMDTAISMPTIKEKQEVISSSKFYYTCIPESESPDFYQGHSLFQKYLDEWESHLIGLEYIVEVRDMEKTRLKKFHCCLCMEQLNGKSADGQNVINHVSSYKHASAYMVATLTIF